MLPRADIDIFITRATPPWDLTSPRTWRAPRGEVDDSATFGGEPALLWEAMESTSRTVTTTTT